MADARLFRAKLTAKVKTGGTWLYSWKEQNADLTTGTDTDPLAFRSGTATINPAVELNNTEVDTGTFVWMRERGYVAGQMRYEFAFPDGSTTSFGSSSSGCGWVAALRQADCLEALILSGAGACGCDTTPANQRVKLTSGDGLTWGNGAGGGGGGSGSGLITSCVPGACLGTTATMSFPTIGCASGPMPTLVRSGSTPRWLGVDTVTYAIECVSGSWVATRDTGTGPVVASYLTVFYDATTIEIQAGWNDPDCTGGQRLYGFTIDKVLCGGGGGGGDSGGGTVSAPLVICGASYLPSFTRGDCNGPCLTLTGVTASAPTYTGVRESCGPNWAVFAFGDPAICTGTSGCGGPAANVLRIRVSWVPCVWAGAGWYCVADCAGGASVACEPVVLADGDQYRTDITICSGPYVDEASATTACPTPFAGPCYLPTPPRWMKVTISAPPTASLQTCFNGTWYIPRVPQVEGTPQCAYQIAGNTTGSLLTVIASGGDMEFRTFEPGGGPVYGNRFWYGTWDGVAPSFTVTNSYYGSAFACGDQVQSAHPTLTITPVY